MPETVTVPLKVAVGVPEIVTLPAEGVNVSPAGSSVTLNLYGPVPPLCVLICF